MKNDRIRILEQSGPYDSPWSIWTRVRILLWNIVWLVFFRFTPKQLYRWRLFLLRSFGCKISGSPYVAPSTIIKMPWNLEMEDRACLGPKSEVYNLAKVILKERSTVSQYAYLCAGTHDFSDPNLPLVVGDIVVGTDVFIGARAFVLPGLVIGDRAVVGACAVVTRDIEPGIVAGGNPARPIGIRNKKGKGGDIRSDTNIK
jgi:putative colanic acid biosynthesis acetyltransferase WcaF